MTVDSDVNFECNTLRNLVGIASLICAVHSQIAHITSITSRISKLKTVDHQILLN